MADLDGLKDNNMPGKSGTNIIKLNAISLLIVICIGGLTGFIATARGTDVLGIFLLLVGSSLFLFLLWNVDAKARKVLLLAFLIRLWLTLTHAYVTPLPDSGADAIAFERIGWQVAEAWLNGETAPSLSGAYLYSLWIGALYYLFGRIPLVAQFANVLFGTFIVYLTWKLALWISGAHRPALIAALLTALFPTLNLYSAITMRESLIVFFTAASVYCFFLWLRRGRLSQMLGAVLLLLPASILNSGMIFIEIAYAFFFCFFNPRKKRWKAFSVNTFIAVFLFIFVVAAFGGLFSDKLPQNISSLFSPDYLGQRIAVAARGRAAYLSGLTPNSIGDMLIQTPLRIVYFNYTPFPWMVSSLGDVVGLADALLYIALSVYALKGLAYLWHKDRSSFWSIVLILAIFMSTFAWGTSNYGTAIRHRQKMVWFLIIPAAIGLAQSSWWRWLYPAKKLRSGERRFRNMGFGLWTTCYHHNQFTELDLTRLDADLRRYRHRIVGLQEALACIPPAPETNLDRLFNWCWRNTICFKVRMERTLKHA